MILAIIFILGLALGSFANVLIDRLPRGESIVYGRSHCDFCRKKLRWFELLPVISFIIQRGRCLHCHKRLSVQYPLIEMVTAIGLLIIYQLFSYSFILLCSYGLIFLAFLVIFVADLKYQIIPDSMVILGLLGALGLVGINWDKFAAGAGAALFFWFLYIITRRRGMGFGDVKLAFLLGFLLGMPKIIVALYVAFLTGAATGVILILGGKKKLKSKISFGPFLIFGLFIALVWGENLSLWFINLF